MDWLNKTKQFHLSNGLTILTYRIPTSPAAALHFCVKAGYFCEQDFEVGLAHLLEHMYFKGSARFPLPGTMGITLKGLGGIINATTSYDQTNYFCEVPCEKLLSAIDIMSDAFLAPLFPAEELNKECEVVIEEFNRKLDSPAAYSQEKLIQLAFTKHRMRRWRIGSPEQLRSFTSENLFDYFHRYYQPQNMIVTVTGNFDEEHVVLEIERSLGLMKNAELKKDLGPAEPPQTEMRFAHYEAAGTLSYLHFGLHGPGVRDADVPVLEFLSFLLSIGRSARLHRYLVEEERSASSASCSFAAYDNVGLIFLTAVTEAEKIREAGRDLWTVVQDLSVNGPKEEDLAKVKSKIRLHQAMQTEDALQLAQLLSYYESYGGYELIAETYHRMQECTGKELEEVAAKYLRPENLNILELTNREIEPITALQYSKILLTDVVRASLPKSTEPAPVLIESNGANHILDPNPNYQFVSAGIFFLGGRNEENEANAGITNLLFRTALKGTARWNAEQLAFRFDALGNQPRYSCYRDFSGFVFECLPENFQTFWNLLVECIAECSFPEEETETEKGKMISAIRRNMDDNFVRPMQLFQRAYYGSHPYGLPETGFEESVASLSLLKIADWKQRLFSNGRATIALVGRFDVDEVLPFIQTSMKLLPVADSQPQIREYSGAQAVREAVETRPKKQTAFVLGFPAPAAGSEEIHQYEALQQILSGMGGRLFLTLRSKKSLAYTVYAGIVSSLYSGSFITYIAGEATKEKQAIRAMWQELQALRDQLVTPAELANAKNALIGGYSLAAQTASSRLLDYVYCRMLHRPIPFLPHYKERILAVTQDDIRNIAQKVFSNEHSTIGIVRGMPSITDAEKVIQS